MTDLPPSESQLIADDVRTLHRMGYAQELLRRMSGFSNFAISLSIICILAGGITSFHLGFGAVGGAAIGIGWPLVCLFSLAVAATMGQVASAFPTAGGLYHWASILGGKGWGWATAWFNLAGLVTVLAAINVGTYFFVMGSLGPILGWEHTSVDLPTVSGTQFAAIVAITLSQALINHLGIRITTLLTDFSGYWILLISVLLTGALLGFAPTWDFSRLFAFANNSGLPEGRAVWPATTSMLWLFALGFLLPAYTITGFDASAHTSEETVGAGVNVPRGIVRSVLISGIFGWVMLSAFVLAMPSLAEGAQQGDNVFFWMIESALPRQLAIAFYVGIAIAQYLCGLATVTSASRMTYAFARDGGLPFSSVLRQVSPTFRSPGPAIWTVAGAAILFTILTPVYSTITAACTIFLYISYVIPTALGIFAYGRTWRQMGPWSIGPLYRPLAVGSVLGCGLLLAIGMAPPNDKAFWITAASSLTLAAVWFAVEQRRFEGPPVGDLIAKRQAAIHAVEEAIGEAPAEEMLPSPAEQPTLDVAGMESPEE